MERPSSGVGSLSICTMPKKRVGSPPFIETGVRTVSSSTMPPSTVAAMEDRHTGWRVFIAWRSSETRDVVDWDSQWPRKLVPLSSKPKRSQSAGAGETVNGTARILVVENEGVGEKALDGARIDIGLIRDLTPLAQPAPISDQQMRILVLHGPAHL